MKIIDMHCDTIMQLYEAPSKGKSLDLRDNDLMISLNKMKKGDYLAQCFAMFVPLNVENPFETCMKMIDIYYCELEKNKDLILPAFSYRDIIENQNKGKMSAILTIEEGGVAKGSLEFLRDFYRLGVRMITLTWNFPNEIGYPNFKMPEKEGEKPDFTKPNNVDGLTPFGIEMVKEMNRLGIVIDVSHLSDAGFYDVCKYSTKPFVASHSNAREVCGNVRNLTDDMILALAKKGGVTGINYCTNFVGDKDITYVSDLVKHIKHIASVGGIDCVALGSDFDGIGRSLEMNDASKLGMLYEELKAEGFSEDDIEKICYKNVLRVFEEVLK